MADGSSTNLDDARLPAGTDGASPHDPTATRTGDSGGSWRPAEGRATEANFDGHATSNSASPQLTDGSETTPSGSEPGTELIEANKRFLLFAAVPSWLLSMILHIGLLFMLALIALPSQTRQRDNEIELGNAETTEIEDAPIFDSPMNDDQLEIETPEMMSSESVEVQPTELVAEIPDAFSADQMAATTATAELDPFGQSFAMPSDLASQLGGISGDAFEGRGAASRAKLVAQGGGTEGSERAVQMALKWLKEHQNPNGSWNFKHLGGACPCGDPGHLNAALNGATAMALLPFLGAGHTHLEGQYQREVQAGLYFLLSQQKQNGSFADAGNLYSHGLCAIVLCEAYGMTQDQALMVPAQGALDFIAYAQDPVGGGWRYQPRQPGDTSVVGWQLMALKSGKMAYLHVNPPVFAGASRFLDSVQTESGSSYGYKDPGKGLSTSAIGLLCRMYLGWGRDEPALQRGVERISQSGPSNVDMYYNYYATQVMRHYEGEEWERWNEQMREFLVKSQEQKGHETGSWFMGKNHSSISGGRLYCTSMATMILEVYYRHMPLYRKQVTEDDFEL